MSRELIPHNRPLFDEFHPGIYRIAVGLVAWFVLAAWVFFDRRNDVELPLIMVSVLLFVAVVLPSLLFLVGQRRRTSNQGRPDEISFRDWMTGDLSVWSGSLRSTHAAVDMLLPLAAGAFGLTAIGVVFLICANAAS